MFVLVFLVKMFSATLRSIFGLSPYLGIIGLLISMLIITTALLFYKNLIILFCITLFFLWLTWVCTKKKLLENSSAHTSLQTKE